MLDIEKQINQIEEELNELVDSENPDFEAICDILDKLEQIQADSFRGLYLVEDE